MKELSLNILDIAENSVKARATLIEILLYQTEDKLTLSIIDNGCGMDEETVKSVTDPFYTTRTTRSVGLGIPLLKLAAEQTEGSFKIKSTLGQGTVVEAVFNTRHIDFTPLGDVTETIVTLIQGHPDRDFFFRHTKGKEAVELDTRVLKRELEDVPLSSYEVIKWIEEYMREQYENL